MPLEVLYPTISEQIVLPMAVAEAQGVINIFLNFHNREWAKVKQLV